MKLLLDFFPIALFFAAYKLSDIFVATAVGIVATIAQIAWGRWRTGKIDPLQWVSLAIIGVLGGLTIALHDNTFIKLKPTILYWTLAAILLVMQAFMRSLPMKSLMGAQLELPDHAWRTMGWSWMVFFTVMGALNLWVAFTFDENTWVNFKLFGGMGLMVLFVLGQAVYLGRHMKTDEATD